MFFSLNPNHKIKISDVNEYFKNIQRDHIGNITKITLVIIMNNGRIHTLYDNETIKDFCKAIGENYDQFFL